MQGPTSLAKHSGRVAAAVVLGVGAGGAGCAPKPMRPVPPTVTIAPPTVAIPTPTGVPAAEAPPKPPPALVTLQPACSGTNLDLRWIAEHPEGCVREGPRVRELPPGALSAHLEPRELELRSDARGTVDYVPVNETATTIGVRLPLECIVPHAVAAIENEAGERVDLVERCGYGVGCWSGPVVQIAPRGDARLRVELAAQIREEQDDCTPGPPRPLPAGDYTVLIDPASGLPYATARLVVTE